MSALLSSATRLATAFGFYGSVAVYRAGSLHAAAITIGALIPGDMASRETLADLGGGRSSLLGSAPSGSDIVDGDELRATGHTWIVQGVASSPQILVMALSESTN